jgi:hypothetical protein
MDNDRRAKKRPYDGPKPPARRPAKESYQSKTYADLDIFTWKNGIQVNSSPQDKN